LLNDRLPSFAVERTPDFLAREESRYGFPFIRFPFMIRRGSDVALIQVGQQAPGFTLTNQDGATVSLDDHKGKYVLLWWYPKADTPG
jgi:peroxiredoxin Q/BCP